MPETWTVKGMLDWCKDYLAARGDEAPLVSAQSLVSQVTGLSRVELYMNYGRALTAVELDALRPMVRRRGAGEPLQYILGTAPFRYLDIIVRPGVLIPRPETEVLVSEVLAALPAAERRVAADSLMNEYDGAALLEGQRAAGAAGVGAAGAFATGTESARAANTLANRVDGSLASTGGATAGAATLDLSDMDADLQEDEPEERPGDAVMFGHRAADLAGEGDASWAEGAPDSAAFAEAIAGGEHVTPCGPGFSSGGGLDSRDGAFDATTEKAALPEGLLIADICTGSGCIACSLATERSDVRVVATDLAPEAVALARENAAACGAAERIGVLTGDLGAPIEAARPQFMGHFDAVVSNPPYVPSAVLAGLPREVADYEPELALDGGADGLDLYRRLLAWSGRALRPGGVFACELHETCLDVAADLARAAGMTDVRIVRDLAGRPRVLVCRRCG